MGLLVSALFRIRRASGHKHTGCIRPQSGPGTRPPSQAVRGIRPPSRGVTHRIASFVTAVTQFLEASDLYHLNRVSWEDHTALDTLWNTCAAKCKGQLTLPTLRLPSSDGGLLLTHHPRDTAYLWSIAWKEVKQWLDMALYEKPHGTDNILLLRLHHCRCASCSGRSGRVFPRYNTIFQVQEFRQCMWWKSGLWYGMGCRGWDNPDDCPYLRDLWIGVYDETKHQCTTALLRVLLLLGPLLKSAEVGAIAGARPAFVDLWFNLGVLPRIPLAYTRSPRQFSDSGKRSSHESFIDWVADESMG
jgi:hypothetical protein